MKIIGLITLGYPDGQAEMSPRLGINEIIFYDAYDQKKRDSRLKNTLVPRSGLLSVMAKILKRG